MAQRKVKRKAKKTVPTYFIATAIASDGTPMGGDIHVGNTPLEAAQEMNNCCGIDEDDRAMVFKLTPVGYVIPAQISVEPIK